MTRNLVACALAALLSLFVVPPPAAAQDSKPQLTPRGCGVLADMALTARALAVEKIEISLGRRLMRAIYPGYAQEEHAAQLLERVTTMAYGRTEAPMELARLVAEACMKTQGDQDATLGTQIRWSY